MKKTVLVRGARQLLTLRGPTGPRRGVALRELGLIRDGALLIRDGRIEEIGPSRRIENLVTARGANEIDATGRVVMPGFVDSHTHLVHNISWLQDCEEAVSHTAERVVSGFDTARRLIRRSSSRRIASRAAPLLEGMVRHGTTSVEAKSGYTGDESEELKILRALALLDGRPAGITATYLETEPAAEEEDRLNLMSRIQRRDLARFADVLCDSGGLSVEQAHRHLEHAREFGFLLKVQTNQCCRTDGVRLAVKLEAVSADHLERISPEDIALLARSQTIAVLMPGCGFQSGTRPCAPARAMIDSGVAVAVATDFNPDTCPTYSMQMILSLACNFLSMTPAEAISAATINGAHALRCAECAGSLEPGKDADVILLNVSDYREIPYHFGVNLVHMTLKRGQVVYLEGAVEAP